MASPRSRRESADYYRDRRRRKVCNFCVDKAESIDYKEVNRLRRYLSERAKIEPRRKTGTCARHQRMLTTALKRARHLALEQQRGISVTSSVMTFEHKGITFNLLDTPGHEDFSEDTYRTLTAVDSAIMVIDAAKGIEARTRKLFEYFHADRLNYVSPMINNCGWAMAVEKLSEGIRLFNQDIIDLHSRVPVGSLRDGLRARPGGCCTRCWPKG